jgi:hypothetical protein
MRQAGRKPTRARRARGKGGTRVPRVSEVPQGQGLALEAAMDGCRKVMAEQV